MGYHIDSSSNILSFPQKKRIVKIDPIEVMQGPTQAEKKCQDEIKRLLGFINQEREQIKKALEIAVEYGSIEGSHHRTWVIDQMVRALSGSPFLYNNFVRVYEQGEDGPKTYHWDQGTPP